MFFSLAPKRALLSDINAELINSFQMVKESPEKLLRTIQKLSVDSDTYYQIRSSKPKSAFNRAVRFIYLNRTCYGGLHRENQKGEFNTPFAGGSRTPTPLWENNLIKNATTVLSGKNIKCKIQDFADNMKLATKGDLIYCDPTYRAVTRNQFDRYGSIIFNWHDQERLAHQAQEAYKKAPL